MDSFLAPKGRENVAHGASRGNRSTGVPPVIQPRRGEREFCTGANHVGVTSSSAPPGLAACRTFPPRLTSWATFYRRYAANYRNPSETLLGQLMDRPRQVALDGGAVGGVEAHFQDVLLDGLEVFDFQGDGSGVGGEGGFFYVEGVVAFGVGAGDFVVAGAVG